MKKRRGGDPEIPATALLICGSVVVLPVALAGAGTVATPTWAGIDPRPHPTWPFDARVRVSIRPAHAQIGTGRCGCRTDNRHTHRHRDGAGATTKARMSFERIIPPPPGYLAVFYSLPPTVNNLNAFLLVPENRFCHCVAITLLSSLP